MQEKRAISEKNLKFNFFLLFSFVMFLLEFSLSQVQIREKITIGKVGDTLSGALKDTLSQERIEKFKKSFISGSGSFATIDLPEGGIVVVTILRVNSSADWDLYLITDSGNVLIGTATKGYDKYIGYTWESPEYPPGTSLQFGGFWYNWWNSSGWGYSRIINLNDSTFKIEFEQGVVDQSFDDLWVIVERFSLKKEIKIRVEKDTVLPLISKSNNYNKSYLFVELRKGYREMKGFSDSVKFEVFAVDSSGGHDHNGNRNSYAGKLDFYTGMTDSSGRLTNIYTAGEFGGIEKIVVYLADDTTLRDTAEIVVAIPGLALLPESPYYLKVGGTKYHHGPPRYQDDHNHWGQSYLIDAIYAIALNYVDEGGEVILINDISLPYGGLFDINGNWVVPHSTHRTGQNADIEGTGQDGKFRKPQEIEEIINKVAEAFGINISYFWETTHYHFTITQGR